MKKLNNKQISHSINKVMENKRLLLGSMFLLVMLALMGPSLYSGFVANDWTAFYSLIGGGVGVNVAMSMGAIGSIDQPSDIDTAPNKIGFRLWLTASEQIDDTVSFPTPNANRELGTIPLTSGEYMHHFDGVKDSLKYMSTAEKGDVTSTFNKTFAIIVAFNTQSLNFIEQYQGKGFNLIYKECESDTKYTLGSYCKPVYLTNFEVKEDGDGKYITLTFGNDHWRQPLYYTGSIIEAPATVVAQDSTDLPVVAASGSYQLSDPSAANIAIATVSGIASADEGRVITVTAPATAAYVNTIADNAAFVLKGGATWTANPGSQIVFQVFDDSTLMEVDRIQTA